MSRMTLRVQSVKHDTEAVVYCPTCDVFYCTSCLKSICRHVLLGQDAIDRWGQRTAALIDSEVECSNHKGYRLDLYCRDHDAVCCSLCSRLEHRECHMDFVPDVAGEITLDSSMKQMCEDFKQLRKTIDKVKLERTTKQAYIQQNKADTIKSIRDYTSKLVKKLNAMEKDAVEEVVKHAKICEKKLKADLDICNTTATELKKEEQAVIRKDDKEIFFIKLKKTKKWLESTNEMLEDLNLKSGYKISKFRLNLDIDATISNFSRLGNFQDISIGPYRTVNKGYVSVKTIKDRQTCTIEGICQLPDGCIIVSDYNNKKLKKLDISYTIARECSLPSSPYGVCHIDGDEVAVALENKTIQFVSVRDGMALTRSFSLNHDCRGVAHHQGQLYITSGQHDSAAVYAYALSGSQLQVFTKDQKSQNMFGTPWFIALSPSGDTVYVTDVNKGLVTMDRQGNLLATFEPPDLDNATGICVADNGTVLIAGHYSDNVIELAVKGNKKLAELVTTSVSNPNGICIDELGSTLIVAMEGNDCLAVFDFV